MKSTEDVCLRNVMPHIILYSAKMSPFQFGAVIFHKFYCHLLFFGAHGTYSSMGSRGGPIGSQRNCTAAVIEEGAGVGGY